MASTTSRMHCPAGRPPRPASHAGAGRTGSNTAHSAAVMSEGYARRRVLRLIPAGQQRHATSAPSWTAPPEARYNDTQGSWHRGGFDTHAITRSLFRHRADTPHPPSRSRNVTLPGGEPVFKQALSFRFNLGCLGGPRLLILSGVSP